MNFLQNVLSKKQSFLFFKELKRIVDDKNDFIVIAEWILYAERIIDGKKERYILDDEIDDEDETEKELDMDGAKEESSELNEMQKAINENKELNRLNKMREGSTAIFDSLPTLENELAAYENQIRQDTSAVAKRYKLSYWHDNDFPDSFYKSFLHLLDKYEFKSPSFSKDNREKLLRSFIDCCMGIPIASMLLPVLLTLFVSRGYKSNQSIHSMLKARKIETSQKERECLEELFFSIHNLVSEYIEDNMPLIFWKLSIPVFNESVIIEQTLNKYQITDREKMVEYYKIRRNSSKLKAADDTLTDEQKKIVEQLAKIYSASTCLLVMGGVEPSDETKRAIRNLDKNGLLLIFPMKLKNPPPRGEILYEMIRNGDNYPEYEKQEPDNWTYAMRQMYDMLMRAGYMVDYNYNYLELVRCYNLPLDFRNYTLQPDISELCKIVERVSDKACDRILEQYRSFMRKFVSNQGIDLYLAKHLEESKILAGKIAHYFREKDYDMLTKKLSDDGEKELSLWFRDFILDFFARNNITLPPAYSGHQMEVEFECLQTMLSLCTIFARSSLIELYTELYAEKLRKKRTTRE